MWSTKSRFVKHLNRLIGTLLKIHLAPAREKRYKDFIAKQKRAEKEAIMSLGATSVTETEDEADMRLEITADTNPIVNQEITIAEEEAGSMSNDVPRRRLKILKGVIKDILLKRDSHDVEEDEVSNKLVGAESKELQTCVLIINFLKPYIPSKETFYIISHQISLFLMANDILHATGYSKFTAKITPYLVPSNLNTLKVDAPSLFAIFCTSTKQDALTVYAFNGNAIISRQIATESKDAMFGSFFDLIAIKDVCNSYGLEFAHDMYLLPGLKTVRINGTLKKLVPAETCPVTSITPSPARRSVTLPIGDLNSEIRTHQDRVHFLQIELKYVLKERKEYLLQNNINEEKKKWIHRRAEPLQQQETEHNNQLYQRIEQIKTRKAEFNARIREMKEELSTERTKTYLKRKQLTTSSNRTREEQRVRIITQDAFKCIDRVENMKIDNGLLKSENLSEEGNVDIDIMDRAVTNINMLNHYISEQETSESTIQMSPYMQLPKPYKVHGSEVNYKNGTQKYRKQFERAKNTTDIGRQVMETEALLSKVDTTNERRYATSSKKVKLIMFIDGRGLDIGPRIKGYMRYGGHWKPLKHSLYTSVCITNEYNTSQTCIYCFQKLSHQVQTVYKNGTRRLRTTNGAFICDNLSCVSVQAKKAVKGRDTLSAMIIGLSSLTTLLFDATFPQLDSQVSQSNTNKFKTNAASFFTANEDWPAVDDTFDAININVHFVPFYM
ncbi:hypothetical protein CU097_009212 [Rhizopus azygosporus]|uniref:Uncharacterized protein n=1 Tax=Rhizopus azygosporus TaxID=86630 RepID=A0A367JI83_RHIAZ|nr:hypothetical protein CU097_009212 [Rhizopus azygosporus]